MKWLMNLIVTSLLFFPEKDFYASPRDYGLAEEDILMTTPDGLRLHGWFFEAPQAKAVILFFHGNAGNLSGRLSKVPGWLERGISVFLVDYRGYGRSEGRIMKGADLLEDARSAFRWLEEKRGVPQSKIILYGESIGSYPAVALAREKRPAGLILEAPFSTVVDLAKTHYPWVPSFVLKDFPMDNEAGITQIQAPLFILHGDQDEVCPVQMGQRLYDSAPEPKEFFAVPGGAHNNLPELAGSDYYEKPYLFLLPFLEGA